MKRFLFTTLILTLVAACLGSTAVWAEEGDGFTSGAANNEASSALNSSIGSGVNADTADGDLDNDSAAINCLEENCPDADDILHEGLSGEPEVVCAETDEADCDTDYLDNTEDETALWPLYVSLGALGTMIVLVIIINLLGSRKH